MSDAADTEDAPKKKGGKKALIIGLAAVLLLGAGGAGYWFLGRGHSEEEEQAARARAEEKRIAARVFVTLEPFIVNLADRESERYAQIGIVLEVEGKEVEAKLTAKMPAVRNEVLLLISSKLANQLTSREGKEQLAREITLAAARPLGWTPPVAKGEEEQEAPPPKVKTKDGGEKADKGTSKGKEAKATKKVVKAPPPPNPVANVHFASFIVQ
jgi:flagellar FliL protein